MVADQGSRALTCEKRVLGEVPKLSSMFGDGMYPQIHQDSPPLVEAKLVALSLIHLVLSSRRYEYPSLQ